MRIVTFLRLKEFAEKHSDSNIALMDWYQKTRNTDWENISDIKETFNSVDYVGNNRFVFNIRGNRYRLICIIIFASKKVYIRFIGTHKEYEKINASNI